MTTEHTNPPDGSERSISPCFCEASSIRGLVLMGTARHNIWHSIWAQYMGTAYDTAYDTAYGKPALPLSQLQSGILNIYV